MAVVIVLFFFFILIGLPIGVTLGVAGVAGLLQIGGENFLTMAPKRFFEGLDLFTFMAMPFFILAGEIMNRSGITEKLAAFANALVGFLRGGLAHSNMIASVLFAGMTGAAVADSAAFGNTLVPAMMSLFGRFLFWPSMAYRARRQGRFAGLSEFPKSPDPLAKGNLIGSTGRGS